MRIKSILNQDFENLPPQEEKIAKEKVSLKKPLIIFVSLFGTILILLTATAIFMGFNQKGETIKDNQPTPTTTLEFKQEITSPSPYATDAAILQIEEGIKNLDEKIQKTDLKEDGLKPPVLDWQIEFEED